MRPVHGRGIAIAAVAGGIFANAQPVHVRRHVGSPHVGLQKEMSWCAVLVELCNIYQILLTVSPSDVVLGAAVALGLVAGDCKSLGTLGSLNRCSIRRLKEKKGKACSTIKGV